MRLCGLGVDILSLSRAEKFLESGGPLSSLRVFSPREQKRFRKKLSVVDFARVFTAKEAFYKASQRPVSGIHAFQELEVTLLPRDRFEVKWLTAVSPRVSYKAEGCHFLTPAYVGAHLFYWAQNSQQAGSRRSSRKGQS